MESEEKMSLDHKPRIRSLFLLRILSAVFYGVSSFFIVVVNKTVLTSYKFPSIQFVGIGQMVATIVILFTLKKCKYISFLDFSKDLPKKVWPLPFLYLGNLVCGLGGTKQLSLPMFTVLRRFSILMTLIAEYYILSVKQSFAVKSAVGAMILGAGIAAANDLAFDASGYVYVLSSDFFTAANGVYVKKKLESKELGKYGLMFYNALFMILPSVYICWHTGELDQAVNFPGWSNPVFIAQYLASCVMGCILIYSTLVCTSYNSALTTTIVGSLKNIFVTYVGMFIGGDYIFTWPNFLGLSISVVGSLVYSFITFSESSDKGKRNSNGTKLLPSSVLVTVPEANKSSKAMNS